MVDRQDRLAKDFDKKEHHRKFLILVDGTKESRSAMRYASFIATKSDATVTLLSIIHKTDFQHWIGVGDIMREEANENAEEVLNDYGVEAEKISGKPVEKVVREGRTIDEIMNIIEEDLDIATLILGACSSKEGPGPLVTSFTEATAGAFPIPISIVPGDLSLEEIEAITL